MIFKRTKQVLLNDYNFFSVVDNHVEHIDTKENFNRISIKHIGAVGVIPLLDDGRIVLIDQYRSTIDDFSLEVVAGRRDVDNEDISNCALRELKEEVGVTAKQIIKLGQILTTPGFTNEVIHIFVAQQCKDEGKSSPVGIEEIYSKKVVCTIDEAMAHIKSGRIQDSKSIIALYWLKEYLQS